MNKYRNQRTIGHVVKAEELTRESLTSEDNTFVMIHEGDVDWDSTNEVMLSKNELRDIAETHLDL